MKSILVSGAVAALLAGPALADDTSDALAQLRQELDALKAQNDRLEAEVEYLKSNASAERKESAERTVAVDSLKSTVSKFAWSGDFRYRNETVEETGVAAGVLNHPATGVAWLANKFHQHGSRLETGEIILAGSFTRPLWVSRGDTVLCDYGRMGTVSCRFV